MLRVLETSHMRSPSLDEARRKHWNEQVVIKMKGAQLYWNEDEKHWVQKFSEATRMSRGSANRLSQGNKLKGLVVDVQKI